jgi:hypothetical protein
MNQKLSKLTNQIKTTRICNKEASNTFDIQVFEKLMKDKDLVIQNLNGQIVSSWEIDSPRSSLHGFECI